MTQLSPADARRLAVISQGLHARAPFGAGKNAVMRCIEQLGYIQIDTISVINRSHDHALWTRIPGYKPAHLDRLLRERKVLEYWSHAAAYLPMRDYRYCLPYMQAIAAGQKHWRQPDKKTMREVLARITAEGPLMARDFEHTSKRGGEWGWNWKPAKIALEQLFIEGQLIASHRVGFQKVYDLPERVLPSDIDTSTPTTDEFLRHLVLGSIRAHGLVQEAEISYLRKGLKSGVRELVREMSAAGELITVAVKGVQAPFYSTPQILEQELNKRVARDVHLLSPFDNAVIKRRRLQQLFHSDYQIECFVPAEKRQFGYYCLPVLYGADIVGRLDPKADRKTGTFIIKSLHLEKAVANEADLAAKLAATIRQAATFNGCDRIIYKPGRKYTFGNQVASLIAVS